MPLPELSFYTVNAFAPTPHGGNQAAVMIIPADDPRANDAEYMQTIAADFNLSETAYLVPIDVGGDVPEYGLRWFTPGEEVPLCGHATLASAYTLFNYVHPEAKALRFQTKYRGELGATMESARGQGSEIGLSLPIATSKEAPAHWKAVAAAAAGISESDILQIREWDFGRPAAIVQIPDHIDLKNIQSIPGKLLPVLDGCVIYTQLVPAESTADTVAINCRVFFPGGGIDEDPFTGSSWATLTGYYLAGPGAATVSAISSGSLTSKKIDARQVSPRGGAATITIKDGRAMLVGKGWRTSFGTLESL